MRNPKKATTQCLLCRFLHTAKKRGNEKVGGERVPSLSVGDITVAYWGMEWSLQQLSPVTKEHPVRTKEDQGYVSGHGPWEPPDGSLLLVGVRLGTTHLDEQPSLWVQSGFGQLVGTPSFPEGHLINPCHLVLAPQKLSLGD